MGQTRVEGQHNPKLSGTRYTAYTGISSSLQNNRWFLALLLISLFGSILTDLSTSWLGTKSVTPHTAPDGG